MKKILWFMRFSKDDYEKHYYYYYYKKNPSFLESELNLKKYYWN